MLLESRCYSPFANKLLNKPNCEVSSGKSTALSQDSDVEEKQASFNDLKAAAAAAASSEQRLENQK